ncbi:hypothetical protein SAICODRAFT_85664 [Saitoella complicata NRRL Y-17804]|nr:uncharacterized protein SAICODRAFT_85664 [Saitoella complicata NRRL Y-17804]ODQ49987.1 hypothetical protein SAICODRAFT_85664 [Saitoella complicata NRRL Y-17804]
MFTARTLLRTLSKQRPILRLYTASPLRTFSTTLIRMSSTPRHFAEDASHKHSLHVVDDKERLERAPYLSPPGPVKGPDGKEKEFKAEYTGQCFCGEVQFEIMGEPLDSSYCHCRDCQHMHGAPYTHHAIFPKSAVHFTKGAKENLIFYNPHEKKTEYKVPCKVTCKSCHSRIADEGNNMMLMLPGLIDWKDGKMAESFKATHHQYYKFRTEDIQDEKAKFDGWKGDEPVNDAAKKMKKEMDKEKKEKEEKEEKDE